MVRWSLRAWSCPASWRERPCPTRSGEPHVGPRGTQLPAHAAADLSSAPGAAPNSADAAMTCGLWRLDPLHHLAGRHPGPGGPDVGDRWCARPGRGRIVGRVADGGFPLRPRRGWRGSCAACTSASIPATAASPRRNSSLTTARPPEPARPPSPPSGSARCRRCHDEGGGAPLRGGVPPSGAAIRILPVRTACDRPVRPKRRAAARAGQGGAGCPGPGVRGRTRPRPAKPRRRTGSTTRLDAARCGHAVRRCGDGESSATKTRSRQAPRVFPQARWAGAALCRSPRLPQLGC